MLCRSIYNLTLRIEIKLTSEYSIAKWHLKFNWNPNCDKYQQEQTTSSLRRLVSWIDHLPPACWSTFRKSILNTSWAVGLTYLIVSHFFAFSHMQLYMSWYIISFFWLYLYFLNILYFFKYSCTNIFQRRSLCTFYQYITCAYLLCSNDLSFRLKSKLYHGLMHIIPHRNSYHPGDRFSKSLT